jgi:hypothetical protein
MGAIDDCKDGREGKSFDGNYAVECSEKRIRHLDLSVLDIRRNKVVWAKSFAPGDRLMGFGWNPDSEFLAILHEQSIPRRDMLGNITGFFGHPIPDETVKLIVVSSTGSCNDYILIQHLAYSNSRLLDWKSK